MFHAKYSLIDLAVISQTTCWPCMLEHQAILWVPISFKVALNVMWGQLHQPVLCYNVIAPWRLQARVWSRIAPLAFGCGYKLKLFFILPEVFFKFVEKCTLSCVHAVLAISFLFQDCLPLEKPRIVSRLGLPGACDASFLFFFQSACDTSLMGLII